MRTISKRRFSSASFFKGICAALYSKKTRTDRVTLSVQASQDQQSNSVKHPETVFLLRQNK